MAALVTQPITALGITPTLADAAASGGDTVAPGDHTYLEVSNTGGSSATVTIVTPGNDQFGQPAADLAVTVAASSRKLVGPLNRRFAATTGAAKGRVPVTYSSPTGLKVAAFSC